jgi:hypothetical protein
MGRALDKLNALHDKWKRRDKENGKLRVLLSGEFGVTWDEVGIVLEHLNSWSYVPQQKRLDVDVQDYLVTSEIVNRMYEELAFLRKEVKRLKNNAINR